MDQLFLSPITTKPRRTHFKVLCPNSRWVWTVQTIKSEWRHWFIWCIILKGPWLSRNQPNTSQSSNCPSDAILSSPCHALLDTIRRIVSSSTKVLLKEVSSEVCFIEHTRANKTLPPPIPPWPKSASLTPKNAKFMMRLSINLIMMVSFLQGRTLKMSKSWSEKSYFHLTLIEMLSKLKENTKTLPSDPEGLRRELWILLLSLKMLLVTSSPK